MRTIIALLIAVALLTGAAPAPVALAPTTTTVAAACWAGPPTPYHAGQARCWRGVPFVLP